MATKNRGISPDLLIHPGETISDLLDERGMTQKELAHRAGVSEAFLSDVIHGKKDISKGLAMGLEYALGVPVSFWLNLQANYDAELLSLEEEESVQDDEKDVLKALHEVVDYLSKQGVIDTKSTPNEIIISLRKVFKVSRLTLLRTLTPAGSFRLSDKVTVIPDVLGAWLCLSKIYESKNTATTSFDPERSVELGAKLKSFMLRPRGDFQKPLKELFSEYGIDFSIIPSFKGAPVNGYISRKDDGKYRMVLSLRGASADIFWFSLFHELGHIVNGDVTKSGDYIDVENSNRDGKEHAANETAERILLEEESYRTFIDTNDFSYGSIKAFAEKQGVPSYIVIGRLQKEGIIPWSWYQKYKPRYKWAEA